MARKKKKDNLTEALSGIMIFSSAVTYVYTQSIPAVISVFVFCFISMLLLVKTIQHTKQKRLSESGILRVDAMSGAEFEEFLRLRYVAEGYNAQKTPFAGDYSA